MPRLRILVVPDPRLAKEAQPVSAVDKRIQTLMDDMLETMYKAPGIGLAAPQVGVLERVIVLDVAGAEDPPAPLRMANPEIIWMSEDVVIGEEGCLSIPGQYAEVARAAAVRVRYLDETNTLKEIDADGLLAVCLQHEIDHLDGVLFIDYLSRVKRNVMVRKAMKVAKNKDDDEKNTKDTSKRDEMP